LKEGFAMTGRLAIQVGAIENAGPNTLVSFLRNAGSGCSRIDLAAAFVTSAGLDSLLYLLKKTAARGSVRLLTGLYQGFTEPAALWTLLQAQDETEGRLSVRLSHDQHFHWKAYFLMRRKTAYIVAGSSNLTDDGLHKSGELNVVLTVHRDARQFAVLHGIFQRHWDTEAVQLSAEIIAEYERWRKQAGINSKRVLVPLRQILGKAKRKPSQPTDLPQRYWRAWIDGTIDPKTEEVLKETTNWDKKGYSYFSTWKPAYRKGERVVLFDLNAKSVLVVQIITTTVTPVRTPDGRHFAAYRKVRGLPRRRLIRSRWQALKASGLLRRKADAYATKRLSAARYERFVENLRRPASK
jgi:HKD family nuclease